MQKPDRVRPHSRASIALTALALLAPLRLEADEFQVITNAADDRVGSFEWAINQVNDVLDKEDTIRFTLETIGQPIVLEFELPSIMAGTSEDAVVIIDATEAPGVRVEHEREEDEEFKILEVVSGKVTVVELDLSGGDFVIGAGAELGFRYAENNSISEPIVGEGRFFKEGEGVLTLSGDNLYTGGSEVREGVLRGEIRSLPGDFTVLENARLDVRHNGTEETQFDGNVDGEGVFVKSGVGRLRIGGLIAPTGGIVVETGTLQGSTTTLASDIQIDANARLQLNRSWDPPMATPNEIFAGDISGEGELVKSGTQAIRLTGSNSFSGGIQVLGGELIGNASSLPGDIFVDTSSTVRFDQGPQSGVYTGNITGEGQLVKDGTGTLTLAGSSDQTGGTTVLGGRLRGDALSLRGTIDLVAGGSAELEFLNDDTQIFGGLIRGEGTVLKSGLGILVLNSAQQYTGDTIVNGGTLSLRVPLNSGALSTLFIGSRGTVLSEESVQGNIDVSGTLAPGTGFGTFDVGGNAIFRPGSTLSVSVDETANSSRVIVTGNATLEGGTIRLDVAPGLYEQPTTYTLLTASNIAGVGFTNVAPDFAFLDVTLGATGGTSYTIDIEANFSSITQFAVTPNQASTAIAMEEYFQSPDPDVTEVRRSFTVLTVPQVPAVLDQLAGGTLSAFTNGRLSGAQYFSQAVSRRFTSTRFERRSKDASQLLRQVKSAAYQPGRAQQGFGAWVEPFGVFGSFSNQKNALPITSRFYGFVAGLDYRFPERFPLPGSEHVRLGLAAGYASQTVKSDPELMEGDGNAYQVGLYGAYDADRFHVGGAFRYGASDMSTERKIAFEGLYRRARAEFNGQAVSALVETGLRLGDPRKLLIHPIAGFQYTHLTQDPFIETGAGTLSLAVLGQQVDSMVTTLGGGLSRIFTLKGEYGTEPELRFGWAHEFGDIDRNVTGRFYQIGGSTPFVTSGAEPNRNNFWIGAGYTMSFGDRPLLAVHYDAILGSDQTRHVLSGGLYLRW